MTENIESKILPDLFIHMKFDTSAPKKCKSYANSPQTLPETPKGKIKWFGSMKDDYTPPVRSNADFPDVSFTKLKGLEEIGLFSEFTQSKPIISESEDKNTRRSTIHITDFMKDSDKRRIIKKVGGWNAYCDKKQEYQKEMILKESTIKNFFQPKEKKPEFFHTASVSPKYCLKPKVSKNGLPSIIKRVNDIDHLIEKCEQAMLLKPPKFITKSTSPRFPEVSSEKILKKNRLKVL